MGAFVWKPTDTTKQKERSVRIIALHSSSTRRAFLACVSVAACIADLSESRLQHGRPMDPRRPECTQRPSAL